MTRTTRLAGLALTVALLGAACGGGGGSDDRAETLAPATTSTTVTSAPTTEPPPAAELTQEDLEARLLTIADLPSGYTAMPADEDDEDDETDDFCPEATAMFEEFDDLDDGPEAEAEFQKGEPGLMGGAFLMQALGTGPADRLTAAFDRLPAAFDTCREFETTDDDGTTLKGTFAPLSFSKHGDSTFAMHMSGEVGSADFSFPMSGDMVFVRKGPIVMMVFAFGFGAITVPPAELEQIVTTATAKL